VHTFVVPLLGFERGIPASVIGTILGAFSIAAAAVRMLLPLIANRVREWAVLCTATLITALLFGVYPLTTTALAMGVCSVMLGFTLGTVQPMVMSMLHQLTPEARHGEALGLRLMTIKCDHALVVWHRWRNHWRCRRFLDHRGCGRGWLSCSLVAERQFARPS
jgi:sugar phosphate permease